jgi:hypothetical protein
MVIGGRSDNNYIAIHVAEVKTNTTDTAANPDKAKTCQIPRLHAATERLVYLDEQMFIKAGTRDRDRPPNRL